MKLGLTGILLIFSFLNIKLHNSPYYYELMNPFGVPTVTWNKSGLGPWRVYVGVKHTW